MSTTWTVKTTVYNKVHRWTVRFEREHWGICGVRVNIACPAIRITVLGRSIVAGRLPDFTTTTTTSEK